LTFSAFQSAATPRLSGRGRALRAAKCPRWLGKGLLCQQGELATNAQLVEKGGAVMGMGARIMARRRCERLKLVKRSGATMSSTSAPEPLAPFQGAACIGGGVIGGDGPTSCWPASTCGSIRIRGRPRVGEVIANTERAYGLLAPTAAGRLTFSPDLAHAGHGAEWVRVGERMSLRSQAPFLAEIVPHALRRR
jgi:hypothetical protein